MIRRTVEKGFLQDDPEILQILFFNEREVSDGHSFPETGDIERV